MNQIVDRILGLLSTPQGYLIIILVQVLFSFGAYQACSFISESRASIEGKRMRRGLIWLLLAQLFLLLAAWVAWLGPIPEHSFLPVLDRVVALLSVVLIIWLWAFPKQKPYADGIFMVVEAAVVMIGVASLVWWSNQDTAQFFNPSILGGYAFYTGIAFSLLGVLMLIWQRSKVWSLGVSMLVIMLAGYLAQFLIQQPVGDYAWLVRVGEMVSFIILLELPKSITVEKSPLFSEEDSETIPGRAYLDHRFIQEIIDLCGEKSAEQFYMNLTQFVCRGMGVEACLLVTPPITGTQLIVLGGYSSHREGAVDGFTIDGKKTPSLMEAIRTGKIQYLNGSNPDSEAGELTKELGLSHPGQLLTVPFQLTETGARLGILVLSKPDQPAWTEADGSRLVEVIRQLARVFSRADGKASLEQGWKVVEEKSTGVTDVSAIESPEFEAMSFDDRLASPATSVPGEINTPPEWSEDQQRMQEMIKQLEERNRELELLVAKGRPSMEEVEQLREELRAALTDLARIPSALSKSDQKMLELQLSTMKRLDAIGQTELVTSIAQEFRQPLASIIGYTDVLLGESLGILGAAQKKFLERVKASTERLSILMDELVQVLAIDIGKVDQTLNRVNLEEVIDEAVGNIIAQVSEKNITLRVDLPEKLPEIRANKEALQQILSNLLENACLVTPEDGEIQLYGRVEPKENEPGLIHISVTDQGGGIDQVDLPRVFTRRYKADNPLIQGIGDTGVGLSIVKSLVELHKGRVWVDTQDGLGSTFSILIPLAEDKAETVAAPKS